MDFFKGIGDFFGGLFGKKKKQEEFKPVQETSSVSWQPPKQSNGLAFQTDLQSTQFTPEKMKNNIDFSINSMNPTQKRDQADDTMSARKSNFNDKSKTYKNFFGQDIDADINSNLTDGLITINKKTGLNDFRDKNKIKESYSRLSNDDKWDIWNKYNHALNKSTQAYKRAESENDELKKEHYGFKIKQANDYLDSISGVDRGNKSFFKSVGDWLSSGGVVGDLANTLINTAGNLTGNRDAAQLINQKHNIQNLGNNIGVNAVAGATNLAGNIALNLATGGKYGMANSIANLTNSGLDAITDANRNYVIDEDGKVQRVNQTNAEKISNIGASALNAGVTYAGMKGFGPNLNFGNKNTPLYLQELLRNKQFGEIAKGVGKYAAKEIPFATASTVAETGVRSIGEGNRAWNDFAGNLIDNIIGDVAIDVTGAVRQGSNIDHNRNLLKKTHEKVDEYINPQVNPVQNAVLKVEANKNITERLKNAYVDGRLPIPQTGFTPNAGRNARMLDAINNYPITEPFNYGRVSRDTLTKHNAIQAQTGQDYVKNRDVTVYPNAHNTHVEKRIKQEGLSPEEYVKIAEKSIYGKDNILTSSNSNPNNVIYSELNNPSGRAVLGQFDDGFSLKSIQKINDKRLQSDIKKSQAKLGAPLMDDGSQAVSRAVNGLDSVEGVNPIGNPSRTLTDTIPQPLNDVKNNIGEVKYKLTPEQEEFFRNSKIRDENGNLKPVYHGTNAEFDAFNPNNTSSNKWGNGNYLAFDSGAAKNYGNNVKEMYANITSPISNEQKTISFKQYDSLHRRINDGEPAYREDYDMYDNDMDLLWDITNSGQWIKYAQDIKDTTGKDGIIMDDMAITFNPSQTKYTDNFNPTDSPDMRYQNTNSNTTQAFSEQTLRKIIGNEYDIISKTSDNAPRTAQGYVDLKNGIVAILDGKMSTANHEATHIAVNALNMVNPKLANSATDSIVKQYGADNLVNEANKAGYDQILGHKLDMNNVDDVRYAAEERLANDFAKYAEAKVKGRENYYVKKNSIPAQVKAWFDTVIDHLKDMVGRLDSAHNFMYRLERGDFANLIDQQMRVNYGQDNNVLTTRPQMAYRIDPETNIVHIENDILHGVSPKNRAKVISQYFKDNYQGNNYELNFGKDGAARISAKSRNKYLDPNQSVSELILKGKMTGELPDILKVSQKIGEAPDTKNHSFARDGFEYRQSFIQIGDDLYSVKLNVGINDNGKLFYTINGIKKAPESHYRDLSGGNTHNISQDTDNVKMKLEDVENLENLSKDAGRKNTNSTETAQGEMGGQIQPENKAKNDGNPTRKFIETVLENAPPKDFRQAVEESKGKGKYNVRNTESLWKQAVEEVAKDPLGAFKDIEDARSDKAIAKGIALAEYFKAQGDNASSSAVYIKLAERATEAGRKVQALSLIKKSTPEGMLMSISRQIDAYNNLQDKRGRFAKDKIILDDQTRAYWYQRLQEIYEMPTKTKEQERTKKIAMGQFNKEVSKIFPSKNWDKTMAIWKAGLLSAPTTHIRNIVGNTANLIGEAASNIVSVPADFVASKFTGIRSTTFKGTKGYGRGLAEGLKTAGDIMHTGVDTSGDVIAKYDSKDVHFDSKLGKGIQAYADTIFRALNAADKPFKQGMFESSIDSQAYAMAKNKGLKGKEAKAYAEELIKNPTVEMQEAATMDAEMATFQQPTALGNMIRGAKNKGGNAGKALDVFTPFTQVPSAVADQAVNYSPLGLIKAVKQFGDVKKAINAGLSEAQIMQLQRKAVKQTGRFLTGTALIGAGVILAKNGMLSGAAKDDKERRQWQAEGKMENAVKVGNDWFSLDSIAPELLILNAGGQLYKDLRNSNDISATLAKSGLNVAKQFTEQSYMTGLKSGLDAVTDPEQSVGKLFGSLATSAIPNAVKKGAQALDDKQRQINSLEDSLKASIPGLRNTLPQKYDVYGRPMQNDMNFLETLFSPVRRTSIKENNLTNSIDALREKDSDYDKIIPNRPPKTVKIGDENHTLTAEESSEYQRLMGELTSKYMQKQGFNNESFKKLSDDDKVKILTNIKTDVKSAVENHLFNNKSPEKMSYNKKIISRSLSGGQTADPVWQTKEEKKEDLYTRKEAEYEKFKREYDEKLAKGEYSRRGKIEAEDRLKKLEVGKNFMKETRDLYELGKRDFKKLIETAEDGEKVLKEVLAYGDALAKAGIEKNKFRDKYGNIKLNSERGGSRGRSSGGGTPSYKMDTMALIRGALDYSKNGGVATKSYGRKAATRANTREVKRLSGKVNFSRK